MSIPDIDQADSENEVVLHSEVEPTPRVRLWTLTGRLWPLALLFGVVMFLFAMGLDWLLLLHREAPLVTVAISNAFVGSLAAALLFTLLQWGRAQRRLMLHRIETLNEANHHIRNALQAIAFSLAALKDHKEVPQISKAMHRIHWVLRAVLPKVEPTYEPFEGRVRQSEDSHTSAPYQPPN